MSVTLRTEREPVHQAVEGTLGAGTAHARLGPLLELVPATAAPLAVATLTPTVEGWGSSWHTAAKRVIDVVGAVVLLLLAAPVVLVGFLAIRLTDPGPVLFRQRRVGRDGHIFEMLKIRTFPVDHVDVTLSLPNSACPLRVGRLLRRTSIDELPQLWNVLRGDMSLVGPRPERPHFAEQISADLPTYRERHRVPPGITGLAQVRGFCGTTSVEDRIDSDNEYIDSWTFWSDLRILAHTVPTVMRKVRW